MSTLVSDDTPERCACESCDGARLEAFPARAAKVGQLDLRRALPVRQRRMVGPWCFLDRYGPLSFEEGKPMDVAPHPHIGLQTVSWLLDGEVLHRDSLGYESMIRPGELNVMTSGRGITHSEETPSKSSGRLSGVQLWIALPESARHGEPAFEHYGSLPRHELSGGTMTLFAGEASGQYSPATTFSPVIGADVRLRGKGTSIVPLDRSFEHALLVLDGSATLEGEELVPDVLYYTGTDRDAMELQSRDGARILLVGGAPFGEAILMWWNFVARTHEEIAAAREDWENRRHFPEVDNYPGPRLEAPPLHRRATPPAAS
jgi:quercetin 2,3-dioxygenase